MANRRRGSRCESTRSFDWPVNWKSSASMCIEAGFPIASDADAEAVRRIAGTVTRPIVAALARCAPGDIDRAAWALTPARRARIHTFIATSDLHLSRKLRMTRDACLEAAVESVARARRFTDDVEFSAEDATRSDPRLPLPRGRSGHRRRRDDDQSAGHRRLLDAGRNRRVLPHGGDTRAERPSRGVQRALPRRSRPGGGQYARGDWRRRAAGRMHDQRHRRARGQRVARRDRDGDARAAGSPAGRRPAS